MLQTTIAHNHRSLDRGTGLFVRDRDEVCPDGAKADIDGVELHKRPVWLQQRW